MLEDECLDYTWRSALSFGFKYLREVVVPLQLPPCQVILKYE